MSRATKIATCCYCQSKTALRLDQERHELTCGNCGAPLRNLKMLPKKEKPRKAVSHRPPAHGFAALPQAEIVKKRKPKKVKRRKSWLKSFAEEAFDLVEDIFD